MTQGQRLFIAVLILVSLALLATSTRFYRVRRSRPLSILLSGGWPALFVGFAIGPWGVGVIDDELLLSLTPLLMIGLGWIGLMVGLQARREVLRSLPAALLRLAAIDAVIALLAFGALGWIGVRTWIASEGGDVALRWSVPAAALIAAASVGWSMETRSLRAGSEVATRLAFFVRGGGGLAALIAIFIFGVDAAFAVPTSGQQALPRLGEAGAKLATSVGLAVVVGVLGRFAVREAGKNRSELLVVFLGIVALVAGVTADLAASPLFTAMLAGVVIANLAGRELRLFERFILEAEHVVAVIFALLAGVILDPAIGIWGLLLALAIAGLRLLIKPPIFRLATRNAVLPKALAAQFVRDPRQARLQVAAVRQAPLAIAMGVGLYLASPSDFSRRLLAVVIVAGFVSELLPLFLSARAQNEPMSTADEPSPAPEGADSDRAEASSETESTP